jgi:cytochrome d ubiquinol oxidase subunit II
LFAYLAAAYLTMEAEEEDVKEDFRRRAIIAGIAVAVFALLTFLVSFNQATEVKDALLNRPWSWLEQAVTAVVSITAFWSLLRRKFATARLAVAAQVSLILWCWAVAQYPFLVRPGITLTNGAAPPIVEKSLLFACAAGALILFPSMSYLYKVFKATPVIHADPMH